MTSEGKGSTSVLSEANDASTLARARPCGRAALAIVALAAGLVGTAQAAPGAKAASDDTAADVEIKTDELGDDAYVISLAGEVDLYTAPEFKQQLLEVIGQGGKQVVVDFSNTTFIDSTTLGVLVGGVKRLRTNDGQLSLVCSDRNITKIFEITGLDRVFPIHSSREEALDAVSSGATD